METSRARHQKLLGGRQFFSTTKGYTRSIHHRVLDTTVNVRGRGVRRADGEGEEEDETPPQAAYLPDRQSLRTVYSYFMEQPHYKIKSSKIYGILKTLNTGLIGFKHRRDANAKLVPKIMIII